MRIIGYIWALPNSLIGILLALVYWPKSVRWSEGCLEFSDTQRIFGEPLAQTWGWVIYYRGKGFRANAGIRVHERVHVLQSMRLGLLFLIAYLGHFAWLYAKAKLDKRRLPYERAYRGIWAEQDAFNYEDHFRAGRKPGAWGSKDAT